MGVVPPRLGDGTVNNNAACSGTIGSNAACGGPTPIRWWYRRVADPTAVVPLRNDGGTTSTQETWDEAFLGSKFESIWSL